MRAPVLVVALFLLTINVAQAHSNKERWVKGNHAGIAYTGRTEAKADGSVSYDWVGTYLQTDFTGSHIAVSVAETDTSYHNVFIDDQPVGKIKVFGRQPHRVLLADKLDKGTHRLRLQKCTEGEYGCTTIHGFYIDNDARIAAVAPKSRLIEVIGDSYTCGYGAEGNKPTERFSTATENCNQAYGCIVARYFDADYVLVAHSGRGMVRNWGDSVQLSKRTMSHRYGLVYDEHGTLPYDFKAYHPDLVLINLGTNDFSPTAIPTPSQYVEAYLKMIDRIKQNYGDVPVLCIEPHSAGDYLHTCFDKLKGAVASKSHVYIANPMPAIVTPESDMGAAWHPNYQGQQKIAMTLIPQISAIMQWQLNQSIK